jgi:hypothetical protein
MPRDVGKIIVDGKLPRRALIDSSDGICRFTIGALLRRSIRLIIY